MAEPAETNHWDVLSKTVEALGVEPCTLAIVAVVVAFLYFTGFTYRHQERMEDKRLSQWAKIMGTEQRSKDHGSD